MNIIISESDKIKLKQFTNHAMAWEHWDTPTELLMNFVHMQIQEYEKALKERMDWYEGQKEVILKSDRL